MRNNRLNAQQAPPANPIRNVRGILRKRRILLLSTIPASTNSFMDCRTSIFHSPISIKDRRRPRHLRQISLCVHLTLRRFYPRYPLTTKTLQMFGMQMAEFELQQRWTFGLPFWTGAQRAAWLIPAAHTRYIPVLCQDRADMTTMVAIV